MAGPRLLGRAGRVPEPGHGHITEHWQGSWRRRARFPRITPS